MFQVPKSSGKAKYELSETDLKKHHILGKKDSTATMFLHRHLMRAAIAKYGSEDGLVNHKNRKLLKKAQGSATVSARVKAFQILLNGGLIVTSSPTFALRSLCVLGVMGGRSNAEHG